MRCSKCGAELNKVEVDCYNPNGWREIDCKEFRNGKGIEFLTTEIIAVGAGNKNIRCPYCKDFPFREIHFYPAVHVVCFGE